MLIMFIVSLLAALLLCCLLFASMAGDELLDAHEAGLALVASRTSLSPPCPLLPGATIPFSLLGNPVRETGPPACMAKLIMLRHKVGDTEIFIPLTSLPIMVLPQINQANTKRRCSVSHSRQAALTFHATPSRPPRNATWGRFGRAFGKQYH